MNHSIRPATRDDIPFLWEMLYHAAHMSEDGAASSAAARDDPHLNIWVDDWGKPADRGLIAFDPLSGRKLGAAWLRQFTPEQSYGYIDDRTPELAIAVLPECSGQGIGSALLAGLIEDARGHVPAIVLTVRAGNPARRLYERHGFVETGRVTNRVGTESSVMVLGLADR